MGPWWPQYPRGSCLTPGLLRRWGLDSRKIFFGDRRRLIQRWRISGRRRGQFSGRAFGRRGECGLRRSLLGFWQYGLCGLVIEGALDLLLGVRKRIEIGESADRILDVVRVLLQIGHLSFAQGILKLALEFGSHPPDLAHVLAERPQYGRQLFGSDRDQRDDADDDELAPTNVEHGLANSEAP